MSAGLITISVTIDGAVEFVATSPIATFREVTDVNAFPASYTARIIGYAYNSLGNAHNVRLVLTAPNVVTGSHQDIILEDQAGGANQINSFTNACGPGGIVVPRRYGLEATAQPPVIPVDAVIVSTTYQAFFSTTGKVGDGTFTLWYQIEQLDGGG